MKEVLFCWTQNPVAHCWSEQVHHRRKFCNVCRKRLDDNLSIHCESKFLFLFFITVIFSTSIGISSMNSTTEGVENFFFSTIDKFLRFFSMRILRAHGVPGFCRGRLQGERHVSARKGLGAGKPHSSLARRQSSQQFEMRCLQEKLFFCRVPFRVSLRVVRHDGKCFPLLSSKLSFLSFRASINLKVSRRILLFPRKWE